MTTDNPSITLAPPAEETATVHHTPPDTEGPRIRWSGIVWGLFLAALAFGGLWVVTDSGRRAGINEWFTALTPGILVAYALLAVGILLLVAGTAGLLRRGQVLLARRRSAS
jgi:hypothetical protein